MAAALSAIVPGLGQSLKRQGAHAATIAVTGAALLIVTGWIAQTGGIGPAVFFFLLLVLPWWTLQSYDAYLPNQPWAGTTSASRTTGLWQSLRTAWSRAHDIRYLGALFLLTALTDLYIIAANPSYSLTVFCTKPAGLGGILAKAQSPTLHLLIGYGFMRLRRWALLLYLAYAAFGLLNTTANYACFGYGRIRTAFLLTLIAFTAYVLWRQRGFRRGEALPATLTA
ncbi:MAG: hypothetical protein EPO64_02620 [Nitrospirae bacterium]|nr:MAG: hypothetical protein EPO64_02620 [Nitrospirota bacterium]